MAKKINNEIMGNESAENETSTEANASGNNTRSREKQIEFAKKRAQRQSSEIMRFLQNNRFNYEKTSFINKSYIIFQNLTQINDVNVLVGDSFIKNISRELNNITNLESNIRSKINSNQDSDAIKNNIEQLEEIEKLKIEIANKLKDAQQELKKSLEA
ncbi:hypothetical protein BKH42_03465 [Helicobacter sp. 13S00482-2]|uniref:hypothetical protein n=1 Tax=Helicobacter sp. 13S00482-2 TaxID=1476200 RepID=UPI000BA4EDB8|nr:hypothetical protein [Helicobacter sp. 13S00482-2]PAF53799.1 hypothetical protein BKH42_03465 [Helicobacter sp. 13S00482-2]